MRSQRSMGVWLLAAAMLLTFLISGSVKPMSEAQAFQRPFRAGNSIRPLKVSVRSQGGSQTQITSRVVYRPVVVKTSQVITYQKLVRR